jgi:amidohydrolase
MNSILNTARSLDQIAELGWHEYKTTEFLRKNISIKPIKVGFGGRKTGLLYKVGMGNSAILIRADMDALKTSKGVSHTCGHSTHMAALLHAQEYAITLSHELTSQDKSIYFLYQPAEETFPSGAQAFVNECKDIVKKVSYAFTTHVKPLLPIGTIGIEKGSVWARGDYLEIAVKGRMVHVKDSYQAVDALESAAKIILGIKEIQNRYPKSVRIAVGTIEGGRQPNTLADQALLKADIRLTSDELQSKIKKDLARLYKRVEQEDRTTINPVYFDGYPTVHNDNFLTLAFSKYIASHTNLLVNNKDNFSFGCEDFAFISQLMPSLTAFIGTGDAYDLHEENCTISDQGTLNAALYFKAVVDWFLQS